MSNVKYDTILSLYNNEKYQDMQNYGHKNFRLYEVLPFAKYMLDLGYDLFDFYDLMERMDHLDINGYLFKSMHSYTM